MDKLRKKSAFAEKFFFFHRGKCAILATYDYYWGNSIIPPAITEFQAVLLAPYGASAKHGTYYPGKFTFFKWDMIIYLPE
jgi:hypothetical protein